jgi:hypothetical protein
VTATMPLQGAEGAQEPRELDPACVGTPQRRRGRGERIDFDTRCAIGAADPSESDRSLSRRLRCHRATVRRWRARRDLEGELLTAEAPPVLLRLDAFLELAAEAPGDVVMSLILHIRDTETRCSAAWRIDPRELRRRTRLGRAQYLAGALHNIVLDER